MLSSMADLAWTWSAIMDHFEPDAECWLLPATQPSLPSLTLLVDLTGHVVVVHRTGDRHFVAVADVVQAVWSFFRSPLPDRTNDESSALFRMESVYSPDVLADTRHCRPCRLELLQGRTTVLGLAPGDETDDWKLILA